MQPNINDPVYICLELIMECVSIFIFVLEGCRNGGPFLLKLLFLIYSKLRIIVKYIY